MSKTIEFEPIFNRNNNYLKHSNDIPMLELENEIPFQLFILNFPIETGNVGNDFPYFPFNISLKQPLEKLRFPCNEMVFDPLNINIKAML